ncbi:MAG: hypothetical protein KME42_14085 [Tildeniella nuda ZEHNDER 1965/U140]|jgi:hypothetical protein|nr:hypothetical protein [Tildeniella nuda ZEHNDER 1965/U140]
MSAVEIHNPVVADLVAKLRSLLSAQLGTLADGKQAVRAEPPQVTPVGKGVHAIVQRHFTQLTNDTYQWRVDLVLHGSPGKTPAEYAIYEANLQKFDRAIALMRSAFPVRRESIPSYREDLPPQAIFQITVRQFVSGQQVLVSR